ncbi:hypothetical protein FOC1_g10009996 [Fusarium oxysporum f. sp. cubense race 1]|uniref:Uncharacterized protein n=1 Tax=Fusarium oxysporum f. sp. cubense (strain race 1) TaxID=1229664 RepID=N4V0K1_FUSC1|nr:hypothetical protein FOC1_g10009996 [Fusarium oxysporum f. sp. cubense race 1]
MAPSDIIKRMQDAAVSHDKQELGARETLLDLNRQLLAELETPTDFIQRIWLLWVVALKLQPTGKYFNFYKERRMDSLLKHYLRRPALLGPCLSVS